MIKPQYPLTLEQINTRVLTIISKLIKKKDIDSVRVKYTSIDTIVIVNQNTYCIADERDLIRFKESIKDLLK